MKQKEIKEIAGIIKEQYKLESSITAFITLRELSEKLIDYFEREEKKLSETEYSKLTSVFNPQQFLKDCGVEK